MRRFLTSERSGVVKTFRWATSVNVDGNAKYELARPELSLRTLLLLVAVVAACVAFVVASDNRYHAICWLIPPLFILTRNHRKIGWASLGFRFFLAVVAWSILFFPAVLQDTETWEANNQDWIAAHPGEYDAINENLVAFVGFIPASIYSGFVVLVSCGITFALRRWRPKPDATLA